MNENKPVSGQPSKVSVDFSRVPVQLEFVSDGKKIFGATINDYSFANFMRLEPNHKLREIRKWLQEMYGDEFSRKNVGNNHDVGLSYQGLRDIEVMKNNKIRPDNISNLSRFYGVDERYIVKNELDEDMKSAIYIGKTEFREEYFAAYYSQYGIKHVLDEKTYDQPFLELSKDVVVATSSSPQFKVKLCMFVENEDQMKGIHEFDELHLNEAELTLLDELLNKQIQMMKAQIRLRELMIRQDDSE